MSRGTDFWSRRKEAVQAEAVEDIRQEKEAETKAAQAELEEMSDEDILEELGLPDPDGLTPGQDISAFMQKAVPERLRQRALRQLWRLNPALANLDGLCDYNDDFTNAATDAPGVATAYRVGKGLLKHIQALEAEDARNHAHTDDTDTPENLSELPAEMDEIGKDTEMAENTEILQDSANAAPASTTKVQDVAQYPEGAPLDTLEDEPVRPRRMRFKIEDGTA